VISRGKRYRKVFGILAKHGFDDIVGQLSGNRFLNVFKPKLTEEQKEQKLKDRWQRLRLVLEELGPTYIKFGQILSNRPGLLPDDLIAELTKLQDKVPPFTLEEVKATIEEAFGKPVAQIFADFDEKPLASASIAQVHKATLFTGEKVVIKVQRPGIEAIIKADIEILKDIANLMMRSEELRSLRPTELLVAFERTILAELNFQHEAAHFQQFYKRFEGDPVTVIPKAYLSYCKPKVITIGFIDGIKINKIDELVAAGYDLKKIAENGFDSYFKQIFEWGYFHADPHPGNLLVLPGNRIGILDFGMVGRLTEKDRKALVEFIIGLGRDDISRIVENVEKLQGSEIEDKPALEIDMAAFISDFGGQAARDIDLNDALNRGRFLINKHHLKLNPDLFLLLRSVSMLEGIGTTLDKDFRSLEIIKPFAIKLLSKSLNPRNIFKNKTVITALADLGQLAVSLPGDARKIVDKIKNDKIKVQVEQKNNKIIAQQIQLASRKISFALVFAGSFTGTCLMLKMPYPEVFWGMNVPSLIGFTIAGVSLWKFGFGK
jgi:ubiquinone biosynthesis protein